MTFPKQMNPFSLSFYRNSLWFFLANNTFLYILKKLVHLHICKKLLKGCLFYLTSIDTSIFQARTNHRVRNFGWIKQELAHFMVQNRHVCLVEMMRSMTTLKINE